MKKQKKDESNREFFKAMEVLEVEGKIPQEVFVGFLEQSLASGYKKEKGETVKVMCSVIKELESIRFFVVKKVVATVDEMVEMEDFDNDIVLEEAQKIKEDVEVGQEIYIEFSIADWSRTAIHQTKQVLMHNLNTFKKERVKNEMSSKENEIVTATIRRIEDGRVYLEFAETQMIEGIMKPRDQIRNEEYQVGQQLKVLVKEVKDDDKGNMNLIEVSRSSATFVKKLFEKEVLEISLGQVAIKGIAREAGQKTKMAVANISMDRNIDPVASCIGENGSRVNAIVQELKGEKIDVIAFDTDIARYIAASLSPAKVEYVQVNEEEKMARAIVPDDKLSLAIGRGGINVRLANKLTGWKIDILPASKSGLFNN